MSLENLYRARLPFLEKIAAALEDHLREHMSGEPRIDRISARAKTLTSFLKKASTRLENGKPKYFDPLAEIQDQIGARIITFFKPDVERVSEIVRKYFRPIETRLMVPDDRWKFGYFGQHFILHLPSDVIDNGWPKESIPQLFELQIKTLFQHAWSEANHDVGYKPSGEPLEPDDERKLSFTSAQAWGADHIFAELHLQRESRAKSA